jgi:hypothetical protein
MDNSWKLKYETHQKQEDLGDSIFVVSSMATFEAKEKTNNPDY